ncbi:MAG: hypothetical protein ACRDZ2_09245 [Ilumatobacteraceae bacterium]
MTDPYAAGAVAPRRPVLLGIVTILMIIAGVIAIISGIIAIVLRNNAEVDVTPGTAVGIGIAAIISGLISIALAMALRRGSRIARTLVAIYEVLHIIGLVIALIRYGHGTYLTSAIISIVFALIVLYYLYGTQGSREFFGDPAR